MVYSLLCLQKKEILFLKELRDSQKSKASSKSASMENAAVHLEMFQYYPVPYRRMNPKIKADSYENLCFTLACGRKLLLIPFDVYSSIDQMRLLEASAAICP
jgi:hypothetical protein